MLQMPKSIVSTAIATRRAAAVSVAGAACAATASAFIPNPSTDVLTVTTAPPMSRAATASRAERLCGRSDQRSGEQDEAADDQQDAADDREVDPGPRGITGQCRDRGGWVAVGSVRVERVPDQGEEAARQEQGRGQDVPLREWSGCHRMPPHYFGYLIRQP